MEIRQSPSVLIEKYMIYPSRKRVLHRVRSISKKGNILILVLDCGIQLSIKDSKRGRVARWLEKVIYWKECKKCRFLEDPRLKWQPREALKVPPEKIIDKRRLRLGNFDVRTITRRSINK